MVRRRRCFTFQTFTYSIKSKRFISLFSSGLQEISYENIAINQKKENSRDDTDPSIANFVDDILNKIRNFRLVQEGKKKSVRYTAREIRLALSLYNMSQT